MEPLSADGSFERPSPFELAPTRIPFGSGKTYHENR